LDKTCTSEFFKNYQNSTSACFVQISRETILLYVLVTYIKSSRQLYITLYNANGSKNSLNYASFVSLVSDKIFSILQRAKSQSFRPNSTFTVLYTVRSVLHWCLRLTALKSTNHSRVTFLCTVLFFIRTACIYFT
jgi:hypothetical protein